MSNQQPPPPPPLLPLDHQWYAHLPLAQHQHQQHSSSTTTPATAQRLAVSPSDFLAGLAASAQAVQSMHKSVGSWPAPAAGKSEERAKEGLEALAASTAAFGGRASRTYEEQKHVQPPPPAAQQHAANRAQGVSPVMGASVEHLQRLSMVSPQQQQQHHRHQHHHQQAQPQCQPLIMVDPMSMDGSSNGGGTASHKAIHNGGGAGGGNPFLFPSFEPEGYPHHALPHVVPPAAVGPKLPPHAHHYQQQHYHHVYPHPSPSPPPPPPQQQQQPHNPRPGSIFESQAFQALNTGLATSAVTPGLEDVRVGSLPGLRPEFMRRYEKETKKHRAPREDLSNLTAEEKVERRKARARIYSHYSRKRDEARMEALEKDVSMMQVFQHIVEDAPDMLTVISPDLDSFILFANEAFSRVLGLNPKGLVGKSLWTLVHPKDHARMNQIVTEVILAPRKKLVSAPISCNLTAAAAGTYVEVQVKMNRGSQGIICSFWESVGTALPEEEKKQHEKGGE